MAHENNLTAMNTSFIRWYVLNVRKHILVRLIIVNVYINYYHFIIDVNGKVSCIFNDLYMYFPMCVYRISAGFADTFIIYTSKTFHLTNTTRS